MIATDTPSPTNSSSQPSNSRASVVQPGVSIFGRNASNASPDSTCVSRIQSPTVDAAPKGGAESPGLSKRVYWKLSPQEQLEVAFGFLISKPVFMRVSVQSMTVP